MKHPKMKILSTGEIVDVASLAWMDNGTTLRAFPLKQEQGVKSYVIVKGEGEATEVGAELILQ